LPSELEREPKVEAKPGDLDRQMTNVVASGDRSVAIGGNANNSTIVTGDGNVVGTGNVVQRGKYNINIDTAQDMHIGDRVDLRGSQGAIVNPGTGATVTQQFGNTTNINTEGGDYAGGDLLK
jgi:hypothetical protein